MKQLEDQIRQVLFELGQNITLHKITNENFIVEIDYEVYVEKLKSILGEYNSTPETLE